MQVGRVGREANFLFRKHREDDEINRNLLVKNVGTGAI